MKSEVSKGTPAEQGSEKRHPLFAVLSIMAIAMLPEVAFAGNPWDNMLNGIIGFLNGGTTRLIAIVFIIGLGFLAWSGKLTMGKAAGFIGGIVLVFGAAAIADLFIASV